MLCFNGIITCTSLRQTSDIRLKNQITALIKRKYFLDKINKLFTDKLFFKFKNDDTPTFGLIAQEVEKIYS